MKVVLGKINGLFAFKIGVEKGIIDLSYRTIVWQKEELTKAQK
jgi:hypothetical protein